MPRSRYAKKKINGRTLSTHRLVWEAAFGPIPPGHVVHHINEDRFDNRLENLQLMTHQEHSAHHNNKHPRTLTCAICRVEFTPAPTKRGRAQTCSWACRNKLLAEQKRAMYAARRVERAA